MNRNSTFPLTEPQQRRLTVTLAGLEREPQNLRETLHHAPAAGIRLAQAGARHRATMKLLILSDIHGNWPALQAVLQVESDADQVLCLGDLVNYGPQPAECVRWPMNIGKSGRFIQATTTALSVAMKIPIARRPINSWPNPCKRLPVTCSPRR